MSDSMLNFTVGPVMSSADVLKIGAQNCPYFRTAEFSDLMLESERLVKNFAGAPDGSRAVFLTGSGTASMEATVMNVLTSQDQVLVVNGGSFGHRFCELCATHRVSYDEIKLNVGEQIKVSHLDQVKSKMEVEQRSYTALLVNKHETSTGVHYDMKLLSEFCKKNGMMLIVDNISSFLADEFNMAELGADVMIAGSQKALACPPGVSVIVMSPRALERVAKNDPKCMYFDLKNALKNQERGQTPFTPAVGTLLQINARLKKIEANGGVANEIAKVRALADDFRSKIMDLPLKVVSECMSNAVTPLAPTNGMSAYDIFLKLKDEHGIWICPNGGELKDRVFRVGHIGALTVKENDMLISAFRKVMGGVE